MDTNSSRKNVVRPGPATGKYVQGACKVVLRWADSSGFAVQSYNHKSGVWRGMVPEKSTGGGIGDGRGREERGGGRALGAGGPVEGGKARTGGSVEGGGVIRRGAWGGWGAGDALGSCGGQGTVGVTGGRAQRGKRQAPRGWRYSADAATQQRGPGVAGERATLGEAAGGG
jgi:hypothetical protein